MREKMRGLLVAVLIVSTTLALAESSDIDAENDALAKFAVDNARDSYREAQRLKRLNRFDEAHQEFEILVGSTEPGTEQYAKLASDELRYGLPMFEANYWLLKLGSGSQDKEKYNRAMTRAEQLYNKMLEMNHDNPDRVHELQKKLDQLHVTKRAIEQAFFAQARAQLNRLRMFLDQHMNAGQPLPDQRALASELATIFTNARMPADRMIIKRYWKTENDYYLILKDIEGGPDVTIKGDSTGSEVSFQED